MSLIECKKLNIGYSDKIICKDITFDINKGDYVCIIGENGCGKSTFIKSLLGLNKVISGKVTFDSSFNRKLIGYLPQQTELQKDFPATVREIVMSGMLSRMGFRPFYTAREKDRCNKIMKELSVDEFASRSFRELSGGQQQRVLLARALCATDELLVMDEPTNNLDSRSMKLFYKLIAKLNKENGITIVMVTHDLDKVINSTNKIVYLKDQMKFVGNRDEFLNSEYAKLYNFEEVK